MDSDPDEAEENGCICPICQRSFKSLAAIRQHWARGHSENEFQDAVQNNTQSQQLSVVPSQTPIAPISTGNTNTSSSIETIRSRATCSVCGFLAKNERGLNVHARSHVSLQPSTSSTSTTTLYAFQPVNEGDLIRKFGELLYKCKCSLPLVRIIQKSVRTAVCQELTKVVEHVVAKNDILAWFRLLSFPIIVLNTVARDSCQSNQRPNFIRHNLSVFSKLADIPSLFNQLLSLLAIDLPKKKQSQSEKLVIKIAQRKIGEGDIGGAVRVLCSQEGIADNTPENIEKLKSKHPHEENHIESETLADMQQFDTSAEQVLNSIRHFPISSSGGIDGLRPRHLKDLISFSCGDASPKLVSTIAKLVNIVRGGKICEKLLPIFYGAALIALAKKNGDIRPIAIGLVWRRLSGKIACFCIKDELALSLGPIQNGFGVKGGAEAIVHAVRTFALAEHNGPVAIVKFDYRNAFNELYRKYFLGEIKREAPSLFPMMQQAYRCPSDLFFGDIIIESKRGTQQGDPCASVAFCIALKRLTHSLSSDLNTWFFDDGTIGGNFHTILDDISRVLEFGEDSGLTLNPTKCELFFVNASPTEQNEMTDKLNQLLPGIKRIDATSFQMLGAPVLNEAMSEMLSAGFESVKTMCKRLALIDTHPALVVLRCSLSSPRFQYVLRTSPTFLLPNQLEEIDKSYRQTLEVITNNKISDSSWTQASLPLHASGLGIRKLVDLSQPSYFSSVYQSESLSNQILAKTNLSILTSSFASMVDSYPAELTPVSPESRKLQHAWDTIRVDNIHRLLLESSNPVDRARLLASSSKTSSKWLQVVPSHQLGLMLDNDTARIAVALRLGSQVCEPHFCICGAMVFFNGHHALACTKTKGIICRHHEINKIIAMAFRAAGFPNTTEPYGISRSDGKRPDGMTSFPWYRGQSLLWDVTVVDTVASSNVTLTSNQYGAAADQAERNKHNKYIDLKQNYAFTPIAFESFGSAGPETELFLKKLGKLMKRNSGEPRALDYLLQRISIAIQRGNAVCIRNTYCDSGPNVFL